MAVYFVLRSHYQGPTGKFVRQFEEDSILAWFQNRWRGIDEDNEDIDAADYTDEICGCSVYGFSSLFLAIAEHELPPPTTTRELAAILDEHLYVEGEVRCEPHAIQVFTDDDELQLAYFFFDDTYRAEHPEKTAFLLHEPFDLPTEAADIATAPTKPTIPTEKLPFSETGEGAVYASFISYYDSLNLSDLTGAYRIEGIRLPELPQFLTGASLTEDWPVELILLRTQVADSPDLAAALTRAGELPFWTIAQAENEKEVLAALKRVRNAPPEANAGKLSNVQASEHVAQLGLHVHNWGEIPMFHRWIFFDDLWLAAHPDLGNAILDYALRWDVLSKRKG